MTCFNALIDGSGFGSGWFLDNVVVANEKEGKQWVFNCGRWLDKVYTIFIEYFRDIALISILGRR